MDNQITDVIKNPNEILPEEFLFLTEHCQLCFLTTSRDNIPDIHIMFFTYHHKDNVIILTTKKDKKYEDIVLNPNTSILIHSFEGRASSQCSFQDQKPASATVYSKACIPSPEKEKEYRQTQINAHPKWGDAFRGEEKAVIAFPVEKLLIVDVKGKVTRWSKLDG